MQVTLFSKPNCHHCDAIKYELMDLQAEYGFVLRERFIEDDPDDGEREEPRVPFVVIERDSKPTVRFAFPVKQAALRRAIRAEINRQTGGPT